MTFNELRAQVALEAEQAFEESVRFNGELVFARRGLRIYKNGSGGYRCFTATDYDGPHPESYVAALVERDLEAAAVDAFLTLSPEERRQRLLQGEQIAASADPDLRTAPFLGQRTVQRVSNGSQPTKAQWPSPPARPTTRATRKR